MKYRKLNGWKYELMAPLRVAVPELQGIEAGIQDYVYLADGVLILYKRYAWDGASGVPDNPDNMRASAVHDALYQLMRWGILDRKKYKDIADKIFRRICIADGMKTNWADFMYDMLKNFGEGATKPDKHPKGEIIEI